jgi:crotonobetainyl-CoA:carnitine CoA-transferase CaiB-like acyl-CoA transferase
MLPLKGVRLVSLALNLPGPAAVVRLRDMGVRCTQVLPPAGDPMALYSPQAYQVMTTGIRQRTLDLKSATGQRQLYKLLANADVLLTSFRPSALHKLGLDASTLRERHPHLCVVCIVGAAGPRAQEPGHDLTYQAEAGLVTGLNLPASLLADMAGALVASEAVLKALWGRQRTGQAAHLQVALADAAQWLALPVQWGLAGPGTLLGGRHAGYRVYACKGGRVALAALEPHFAAKLGRMVGLGPLTSQDCLEPATHDAVAAFMARRTRRQLEQLAQTHDLPLHTLPA